MENTLELHALHGQYAEQVHVRGEFPDPDSLPVPLPGYRLHFIEPVFRPGPILMGRRRTPDLDSSHQIDRYGRSSSPCRFHDLRNDDIPLPGYGLVTGHLPP